MRADNANEQAHGKTSETVADTEVPDQSLGLARDGFAPPPEMLSPRMVETLTDIARRSGNLVKLYAERLQSDDGYQVIDPRTVTATFQEFVQKAAADPTPIIKEQFALWSDWALLWQRTASRILFNTPVEPVIAPAKQDKSSSTSLGR